MKIGSRNDEECSCLSLSLSFSLCEFVCVVSLTEFLLLHQLLFMCIYFFFHKHREWTIEWTKLYLSAISHKYTPILFFCFVFAEICTEKKNVNVYKLVYCCRSLCQHCCKNDRECMVLDSNIEYKYTEIIVYVVYSVKSTCAMLCIALWYGAMRCNVVLYTTIPLSCIST